MPTTAETPQSLNTTEIIKDKSVSKEEAKQVSDFLNKNKNASESLTKNPIFLNAMITGTDMFIQETLQDIRKITKPEEFTQKKEAIGHYQKILNSMNIYDENQGKQIASLTRRLENIQKDIKGFETDPLLEKEGHKIENQGRFGNSMYFAQETSLGKGKKVVEIDKQTSKDEYIKRCDNVMKQLFKKPFAQVRMNEIYNLSDGQKANLAYQLAVLQPTSKNELFNLQQLNLTDKLSFISKPTSQEISTIKNIFSRNRKPIMEAIYTSFFAKGKTPAPITESFDASSVNSPEEQKEPGIYKNNYRKFAFEFKASK